MQPEYHVLFDLKGDDKWELYSRHLHVGAAEVVADALESNYNYRVMVVEVRNGGHVSMVRAPSI